MTVKSNNIGTEMSCDDARDALSAMMDGEAYDADFNVIQRHLDVCPECKDHFDAQSALHVRLREECIEPQDPDLLWNNISAAISAEEDSHSGLGRAVDWRRVLPARTATFAAGAVVVVVVLILFNGSTIFSGKRIGDYPIIAETVGDFVTFRVRGYPLDIKSPSRLVIMRWLAERVDFRLPSGVVPPAGFRLVGGRICSFLNRRLVFFLFKRGKTAASLYVMSVAGLAVPDDIGGRAVSVHSSKGFSNVIWRSGGLLYVIVSNLPEAEAERFAKTLKQTI